jgi:hypothetical protein
LILHDAPGHEFQGELEMGTIKNFERPKVVGDVGPGEPRTNLGGEVGIELLKDPERNPVIGIGETL